MRPQDDIGPRGTIALTAVALALLASVSFVLSISDDPRAGVAAAGFGVLLGVPFAVAAGLHVVGRRAGGPDDDDGEQRGRHDRA